MSETISHLDQIGQAVERYGLAPTLLILLVLYLFSVQPWRSRRATYSDKKMQSMLMVDHNINLILKEVLDLSCADWVTLFQFHNGVSSLAGVPFLKVSATHESLRPNRYPFAKDFRDLPVSLFVSLGIPSHQPGPYVLADCDDSNLNPAIRSVLKHHGIVNAYGIPLKSFNGSLIGFVVLSFTDEHELTREQIETVLEHATRVSVLLEEQARTAIPHHK